MENPFGYSLQLLEPDFLDEDYNTNNPKTGNRVIVGVELDKVSKTVGYFMFIGPAHHYDDPSYGLSKNGYTRVLASDLIHIFDLARSQQTRGVPMFAPVMKALHQLDGFLKEELIAARLAAAKSLFLTSPVAPPKAAKKERQDGEIEGTPNDSIAGESTREQPQKEEPTVEVPEPEPELKASKVFRIRGIYGSYSSSSISVSKISVGLFLEDCGEWSETVMPISSLLTRFSQEAKRFSLLPC